MQEIERDTSLIPGLGGSPGGGHSNPHGESQDRGSWQATVHGVSESKMTERLDSGSGAEWEIPHQHRPWSPVTCAVSVRSTCA